MDADTKQLLRDLPSVGDALTQGPVAELIAAGGITRRAARVAVREAIAELRSAVLAGTSRETELDAAWIEKRARRLDEPSLVPVINATGVVIHTNLGRAPLPESVLASAVQVARGYSNLEYDLARGARGSRHQHATQLLAELTGTEGALVVNNCAAAVLLALSGLAAGREVIVSRGELVEIGGSFRVPDIMRQSGSTLVEVGTTNRTRLEDYRAAINDQTGLLLKVHRSNFALVGFTEEVSYAELAQLGERAALPTMVDLGSGLIERPRAGSGFAAEPLVREVVAAGVDLVAFSGDKLLGGPQAGLLAGRGDVITRLARHPLLRALRPDKLTFALLEGVLRHHVDGEADVAIPAVRMLAESAETVARRRGELRALVDGRLPESVSLDDVAGCSRPGGGSLPRSELPTALLRVVDSRHSARALAQRLRHGRPPVVGRIEDDQLLLDLRTVLPHQVVELAEALCSVLGPS